MKQNWLFALLVSLLLQHGCGGQVPLSNGNLIQGTVHGGRQPIVGSTVLVFASSGQASSNPTFLGQATTDSSGQFQLAAFVAIPSTGDLIYAVALGGDAGNRSSNENISLMSVAGLYGNPLNSIQINELSTVVSASQLSANLVQVSCQTLIGTSSSAICPQVNGMASGWDTMLNKITSLINTSTGVLITSNTADIENINLQASVLANCVNSSGGASGTATACGQLMSNPNSSFSLLSSVALTSNGTYRMAMSPDGNALYVLDQSNNTLSTIGTDHGALSWIDGLSLGAPYGTSTLFNTLGIDASPDGNYVVAKNSGRFTVFSTSKAGLKPVNGTMDASTFLATFNTVDSSQIVFLNDSSRFFISDPADSMIFSFTMINGQPSSQSILSYNNSNSPSCMAASADSKYLFSCDISNDTLDVFSTATGAVTSVANRIGGGILSSHLDLNSVVVSKDGKYVYVLGNRLTDNVASVVLVYSYDAGQISAVSSVFDVAGDPTALAISPDGNLLAVSTNSPNSIAIYQVDSGRLSWLQSIATDQQASDVKFSPNGRYLYAAVPGPDGSAQGSILSFTTLNSNATDTLSALLNLHSQPSIGAATLFRQLTPQPVFTPVPASAPSTVVIP